MNAVDRIHSTQDADHVCKSGYARFPSSGKNNSFEFPQLNSLFKIGGQKEKKIRFLFDYFPMLCQLSFPESLRGELTPYLALNIYQTCGPDRPPGQDPMCALWHSCPSSTQLCECSKCLCPGNRERNTYPSAEGGRSNPLWGHCPGLWPPSDSEFTHRESLKECQ